MSLDNCITKKVDLVTTDVDVPRCKCMADLFYKVHEITSDKKIIYGCQKIYKCLLHMELYGDSF